MSNLFIILTIALILLHYVESMKRKGAETIWSKLLHKNHKSVKHSDNSPLYLQDRLVQILNSGIPHQVGYGFMMGYASGFALRKKSKLFGFTIGSLFVTMQVLSHNKLKATFEEHNDKVGYHIPSGGGFVTGLIVGFRK